MGQTKLIIEEWSPEHPRWDEWLAYLLSADLQHIYNGILKEKRLTDTPIVSLEMVQLRPVSIG